MSGVQKTDDTKCRFFCDAGLGGVARWLRAAGYETHWVPDIRDEDLIREAGQLRAILLTTDSTLMERRILRDDMQPAVWVSPALKPLQQLSEVHQQLRLDLGEPRCMPCGGQLQRIDKETVRDRIPPRTYRWLNEFFLCQSCGRLFWRGTHWQRIQQALAAVLDWPQMEG